MFIVEWFIKWFTVGEKTVGVKQNLSGESLSSPGFTLWAVAQIRKMKTIICSGHAAHCSVPILKYCGITSHYMILVLEGCCSHQLLWCQLYLRAHANGRRRGGDGETESGSVDPGAPEKISRGLHPTSTTTAREGTAERGLTLLLFLALENIRTKHSRGAETSGICQCAQESVSQKIDGKLCQDG